MADLLFWKIARHENNFSTLGWQLVGEMEVLSYPNCPNMSPFYLEASIEFIKTCVYLRERAATRFRSGQRPWLPDRLKAEVAIDPVIKKALDLN